MARRCEQCGEPVPKSRTRKPRYCSGACRQAAYRRRGKARGAEKRQERGNSQKARTSGKEAQNTPLGGSEAAAKGEIRNAPYSDTQRSITRAPGGTGRGDLPQVGEVCRHKMGLVVRVVGPATVPTKRPRLRCEVLDPGPCEALARGQRATFRADLLAEGGSHD